MSEKLKSNLEVASNVAILLVALLILSFFARHLFFRNGPSLQSGLKIGDKIEHLPLFSSLRLWQDGNHNGISEPGELHTLTEMGLTTLEFDYKQSKKTDSLAISFGTVRK
jgi:hypothetical protein